MAIVGRPIKDNGPVFSSIEEAKAYVVKQIVSQASEENAPLDALEIKMLSWTAENEDIELNKQFERLHYSADYEKRVKGLIVTGHVV